MSFLEANYENAVIRLIEQLGYTHVYGPDVERDYTAPLYADVLEGALIAVNPGVPREAISEALFKLRNIENGKLEDRNIIFTDYLQNGIEVAFAHDGEQKYERVRLIDYDHVERNSFIVANQWTFQEHSEKRPDVVIFVNGLPLVVIELKSPSREETDASEAYRQLRNYMLEIPSFFVYNAFCVMSDMAETRVGTITSGEDRFMQWKTVDGETESTAFADFNVLFEGMLEKQRFFDILRNFICFSRDNGKDAKILAGYHQFYAVRKAVVSTVNATQTDGRGGVFWHTQGSGKSYSMVMFARKVKRKMEGNFTFLIITDREDLDTQIHKNFLRTEVIGNHDEWQPEDGKQLREYLTKNKEFIFTLIHKFRYDKTKKYPILTTRDDIFVLVDEAHRTQIERSKQIKFDKDTDENMRAMISLKSLRKSYNPLWIMLTIDIYSFDWDLWTTPFVLTIETLCRI